LINQTKNSSAAFDGIDFKADGPQNYAQKIDSEIEREVNYMQTQEVPAELSGATAAKNATGGYTNPYWNIT